MNIVVTGASGFVGSRIARALDIVGETVFSFGRRLESSMDGNVPNYRSWDLPARLADVPPADVVVHSAALVGDWGREDSYRRVNVDGTNALLTTFPRARIIYVSTSSVYSDVQPHRVIDEDAPVGDCRYSAYARTKAQAEQLVLSRGNAVVVRPHIVYGPGDSTLLPRLIAARRLGALAIPGNGLNHLSVTHVDNLVDAVVAAATSHVDVCGVFNVSDAESSSLEELLRTIFARRNLATRLIHVPPAVAWTTASVLEAVWMSQTPPRGPVLTKYLVHQLTATHILDIRKARALLGYAPKYDINNGPL